MTTHALHLNQATVGLIRMIMSTLLDFTRSAPGVWKLGQQNHVGGTFFFVRKTSLYCCGCKAWTLCHCFVFARSKLVNQVVMMMTMHTRPDCA